MKSISLRLEGLTILVEGLRNNNSLIYLNISSNEIVEGEKSYDTFLKLFQDSKLTEIDLGNNNIGIKVFCIRL